MMKRFIIIWVVLGSLFLTALPASSHALQPGYLELQAIGKDNWRVFWRKPDVKGKPMALNARLSDGCAVSTGPQATFDGTAWVTRWITRCPGGLEGTEITIEGLSNTQTDVLVRYELEAGKGEARRLTADEPSFLVPQTPGALEVLKSYFTLGLDHILEGFDHLLFVFALLLLIRNFIRLVGAITAFTVAHSITLAAASLGWLNIAVPPVEAIIALSIMFVASEVLMRNPTHPRLSERAPWVVAFGFGLLHGLGFGSALLEIGLPQSEITLALLAFNVGVEAGQLLFICAVLISVKVLQRILPSLTKHGSIVYKTTVTALPYAIGSLAAFWFVERLTGF